MERKLFRDTERGTPQGGIVSPLLANIYLHELDKYMAQYTTQVKVAREELPADSCWLGYESSPGMADLKPLILKRDDYRCQLCGRHVTLRTSELDHIKPVRRFKRPVEANQPDNLWTLCNDSCHPEKTKRDRQRESRVR